jgi:hypothetical protein
MKIQTDTRLIGQTAENIFLSIINQRGIFATSFDTEAFDGIAFDPDKNLFKEGASPFYIQIKCRGSKGSKFNPQGHSTSVFDKMRSFADALGIDQQSLYFVPGFYRHNDIRTIRFFGIPLSQIGNFKSASQYRFSVKNCLNTMEESSSIFEVRHPLYED